MTTVTTGWHRGRSQTERVNDRLEFMVSTNANDSPDPGRVFFTQSASAVPSTSSIAPVYIGSTTPGPDSTPVTSTTVGFTPSPWSSSTIVASTCDWVGRLVQLGSIQWYGIVGRMAHMLVWELMITVAQPTLVIASAHTSYRSDGQRFIACRQTTIAGANCYLRVPIDYSELAGNYVLDAYTSPTAAKRYEQIVWAAA